jgi:inorganic pyrophosphatase
VTIRVFVQNEAGSSRKNHHDEKTLTFRYRRPVSHAYPFPYGFIIGTDADDGCNVDCFVITDRVLKSGQIVECEPIGLMEQVEDGIADHNVLARLVGEHAKVTEAVETALTEHVVECFRDVEGKQVRVTPDKTDAVAEGIDVPPHQCIAWWSSPPPACYMSTESDVRRAWLITCLPSVSMTAR